MWTFGGWGGVNLYLGGVSHNCHLGEVFSQAVTGYFALILNRKSFLLQSTATICPPQLLQTLLPCAAAKVNLQTPEL